MLPISPKQNQTETSYCLCPSRRNSAVTECQCLLLDNKYKCCTSLTVKATYLVLHLPPQVLVQGREWLIQQQHRWFAGQGARQCDTLSLAARHCSRFFWPCPPSPTISIISATRRLISALLRRSTLSGKAMFWSTVMCGNKAYP